MSGKQTLLDAVGTLSESATWTDITDALIDLVARRGSAADFARLYRTQLTADDLAVYLDPPAGIPLADVVAELESLAPIRESA